MTDALKHGTQRVFKRLAYGVAIGLLLFIVARIAAKIVGTDMVGWFIVIFGPILIGYYVLRPATFRLFSAPFSFLFYSQKPLEDAPVMSIATGLRQQQRFEEAMKEYQKIVAAFPDTKEAYLDMIDMAIRDMGDEALGRNLLLTALSAIKEETARRELRDCFDCACVARIDTTTPPERISFEEFDDGEYFE